MIGKKETRKIINFALKESSAGQTEAIIYNYDSALTRFANNYIHQNVEELNTAFSVRTIFGKKIGSASTNSLGPQKIKDAIKWAETIARFQKENPFFVSLPKANSKDYRQLTAYSKKTADFSPIQRAEAVRQIISVAKKYGFVAYGSISNGSLEVALGNSLGTFAYFHTSDVFCNVVMSGNDSTGYAQARFHDVSNMAYTMLAETAAKKAIISENPIEISPGEYTTIFEPLAVSDLINYLAVYAFNGKLFEEGRSYLTGKLGKKVVDKRLTINDDPFNKNGFPFPFDFEGVPKRRMVLVDRGVAKNVVYDSLTASKAKKKSTGHALPAPNPYGPIPIHLVMKGGNETLSQMIKKTKRGLLVTRLHYTNVIDPYKLIVTGMTRDGTFLIENGTITRGVKNLRFTENVFEALNRVEAIARVPELTAEEPGYSGRFAGGSIVPAMKIKDFTFTSATEF